MTQPDPVHLIIPTHTPRYLDFVLAGITRQSQAPASITITSDVLNPELDAMVRACADRFNLTIRYVCRAHQGQERLAQVRNNAVRALIADGITTGRLLFLDGDTYPDTRCIEQHATLGKHAQMVLPARINLTPAQTEALDVDALASGEMTIHVTPEQQRELQAAQRTGIRNQWLRTWRIGRAHKPKLLGGHHSVALDTYLAVNGHDEEYHTWGTEDDDFGRRAYRAGARSIVAATAIPVYHLYHPTRAPGDWHDRPNAHRFKRRDLPIFCTHGVKNPLPQDPVRISVFQPNQSPRSVAPADVAP